MSYTKENIRIRVINPSPLYFNRRLEEEGPKKKELGKEEPGIESMTEGGSTKGGMS